jgi:hypothetical protein
MHYLPRFVLAARRENGGVTRMHRQLGDDPAQIDMSGMQPPSEARMRMCVMKVGERERRGTFRGLVRWQFLWKYFPWYARELRYPGDFCIGPSCMYWFWEDAKKKERGYCSEALKLVSPLNVTQVPAADRYVSTAENQKLFTSLANELGTVKGDVVAHPELLTLYKEIAKKYPTLTQFDDEDDAPTLTAVCGNLAEAYKHIPPGPKHASDYHTLALGSLAALFSPNLIQPNKEWDVHDRRKRIDGVFINRADTGFFAQRRNDPKVNVNYSKDIANKELDQLLGRFNDNRGKLGILTCRAIDDSETLQKRCWDASIRSQGCMIVLTDEDLIEMLRAKSQLKDEKEVESALYRKYLDLLR